jgi:hypothetical protein
LNPIFIRHIVVFVLVSLAAVSFTRADDNFPTDFDGADVNIGERLFLETRFSEYFFTNSAGNANAAVPGDPVVATLTTTSGLVPGPFAGQAMNCRQCHLVDEEGYGPFGNLTLGNRTYCDFAQHSPVPVRDDGRIQTPRNSPTLVDAFVPHNGPLLLHLDGQFASAHDLIIGTLTGRNYGWKPEEYAAAVHHIASIIRNDDGLGYLAVHARGGRWNVEIPGETAYSNVFSGFTNYSGSYLFDPRSLTTDLISPQYRLNMRDPNTTDEQILDTIATLIEAYLRNLFFSQATNGLDFVGAGTPVFNGSPYDTFLVKNNLPQSPAANETPAQYARRLLELVNQLHNPQFVTDPADGEFETQTQLFQFGENELAGLKIFLTSGSSPGENRGNNIGNCVACHAPPAFTDFIFHNTGASQEEYDSIHGSGAFMALRVPGLSERTANYNAYLPPTTNHPEATGNFETPPNPHNRQQADLGLWNVFANPDFPAPQAGIWQIVPQLLGLTTPQIDSFTLRDRHFTFTGGNGVPHDTYYILASTNLLKPGTNWAVIATNTFDPAGHFSFDTAMASDKPQFYYQLSLRLPTPAEVLPDTIARFKTPTLRDLGQSYPYLHTGRMNSIEDVLRFYQKFSGLARHDAVRNADPELPNISLEDNSIVPLAAFLRSLNEDYTD